MFGDRKGAKFSCISLETQKSNIYKEIQITISWQNLKLYFAYLVDWSKLLNRQITQTCTDGFEASGTEGQFLFMSVVEARIKASSHE